MLAGRLQQPINGMQVLVEHQSPCLSLNRNLSSKTLLISSITLLCVGIAAFLINTVLFTGYEDHFFLMSRFGLGYWCGVYFIVSGGLGIGSTKSPRDGLIVSCMVMAIMSAIFASVMIAFATLDLTLLASNGQYQPKNYDILLTFELALLINGTIAFAVSIWQSTICCAATCCCAKQNQLASVIEVQPNLNNDVIIQTPMTYCQGQTIDSQFQQHTLQHQLQVQQIQQHHLDRTGSNEYLLNTRDDLNLISFHN